MSRRPCVECPWATTTARGQFPPERYTALRHTTGEPGHDLGLGDADAIAGALRGREFPSRYEVAEAMGWDPEDDDDRALLAMEILEADGRLVETAEGWRVAGDPSEPVPMEEGSWTTEEDAAVPSSVNLPASEPTPDGSVAECSTPTAASQPAQFRNGANAGGGAAARGATGPRCTARTPT